MAEKLEPTHFAVLLPYRRNNNIMEFQTHEVSRGDMPGFLSLIGGASDPSTDTTYRDTMIREVSEETGEILNRSLLFELPRVAFAYQSEDGSYSDQKGLLVPFAYNLITPFIPTKEELSEGGFVFATKEEIKKRAVYDSFAIGIEIWKDWLQWIDSIESAADRFSSFDVLNASLFAGEKHKSQRQEGTGQFVISHLYDVYEQVIYQGSRSMVDYCLTFLHEILDTTGVTYEELADRFDCDISDMVLEMSDRYKNPELPWRKRKEFKINAINHGIISDPVLNVEIANLYVDMRDTLRALQLHRNPFVNGEQQENVFWYYQALSQALYDEALNRQNFSAGAYAHDLPLFADSIIKTADKENLNHNDVMNWLQN